MCGVNLNSIEVRTEISDNITRFLLQKELIHLLQFTVGANEIGTRWTTPSNESHQNRNKCLSGQVTASK